jgi:hypothetical protein
MILFNNKNLCFLEKPKCASSSLKRAVLSASPTNKDLFVGEKNIVQCNFIYENPYYRHAPLSSAIEKIKSLGKDPLTYEFIALARPPIELFNSIYYYDVNTTKNKNFIFKSPEQMIETVHYNKFIDRRYFKNDIGCDLKIFKVSSSDALEKYLLKKYNLKINMPILNLNERNKNDLNLSLSLKEVVNDHFCMYEDAI